MSDGPAKIDDPADEDLEKTADRLEAALERIVRGLATPRPVSAKPVSPEVLNRLDALIARVRQTLSEAGPDA